MADKVFNGVIRLRKDTEANFARVANTLILADGEVAFVVCSEGIRTKVGDGVSTFGSLGYIDQVSQDILRGYYLNGKFYTDSTYTVELPASESKVYIDKNSKVIYHYDGTKYYSVNDTLPDATAASAGIMKLYADKGQATDGTMTQKAISDGLNTKFEVDVDPEEEMAIFSISL